MSQEMLTVLHNGEPMSLNISREYTGDVYPPYGPIRTEELRRFSSHSSAGRSKHDAALECKVVWQDAHGTKFGSRDFKGILVPDFSQGSKITFENDVDSFPQSFQIYGLDSGNPARAIQASEYIRAHIGLPTEAIVMVSKLLEVPYKGKIIPVDQGLNYLLEEFHQELESQKESLHPILYEWRLKRYRKLRDYFRTLSFYVIERNQQVALRLRDIPTYDTKETLELMEPVLNWVNAVYGESFSGISGLTTYFNHFVPMMAGRWLGSIHRSGLLHGMVSDQNCNAVGTFCDLTTVRGKPLGDKEISEEEKTDEKMTGLQIMFGTLLDFSRGSEKKIRESYLTNYDLARKKHKNARGSEVESVTNMDCDPKTCLTIVTSGSAHSIALKISTSVEKTIKGHTRLISISKFMERRHPGLWKSVMNLDIKNPETQQFLADTFGPYKWINITGRFEIIEEKIFLPATYPEK